MVTFVVHMVLKHAVQLLEGLTQILTMLLTILSGRHGSDLRCNLIITLNSGESCIPASSLLFYRREEGPWSEFELGHDVEYQDTASSKYWANSKRMC